MARTASRSMAWIVSAEVATTSAVRVHAGTSSRPVPTHTVVGWPVEVVHAVVSWASTMYSVPESGASRRYPFGLTTIGVAAGAGDAAGDGEPERDGEADADAPGDAEGEAEGEGAAEGDGEAVGAPTRASRT